MENAIRGDTDGAWITVDQGGTKTINDGEVKVWESDIELHKLVRGWSHLVFRETVTRRRSPRHAAQYFLFGERHPVGSGAFVYDLGLQDRKDIDDAG